MDHQLFEDWLFSEEPLTSEEKAALKEHLQTCESCHLLSTVWKEVEGRLREAPMAMPEPGFTSRWQVRLEADRQRLQRRQSLAMLAFNVSGAALLLGSLAILAWPLLKSPSELLWNWFYQVMTLVSFAELAQALLSGLFQTATGIIPIAWWVILAGLFSELAVLWVVSYRVLTNPRRITQ